MRGVIRAAYTQMERLPSMLTMSVVMPLTRSNAVSPRIPWLTLFTAVWVWGCSTEPSRPLFQRLEPDETGIDFVNMILEDDTLHNPIVYDYVYNGGGVAAFDANADGLVDLFFTGNMVSSRLYLNKGNFRFEDGTERAGLSTSGWATGVTIGDVNADGLPDLYICMGGNTDPAQRRNLLFVHQGLDANGYPTFAEQAEAYGIADTGFGTQAAFLDYDLDGDLDLFVANNYLTSANKNEIRPRFTDGEAPSTDRLYRNDGNGRFTDVSREAGILYEGYALGLAVADFNLDGYPDIYVSNDFITNDLLYLNNGDGTFTNRAPEIVRTQTHNGMGMDVADFNNDGLPDIVVLDMLPPDHLREKLMVPGMRFDLFQRIIDLGYEPQYMRNTLQLNDGLGPNGLPVFLEIGRFAGIESTDWSWSPLLADFDNDGLRDLFISNGYRLDVTNLDFIESSQEGSMMGTRTARVQRLVDALESLKKVPLPNRIFRNRGDLSFEDRTARWGFEPHASFANGALFADLDNDGALDLVVNNIDEPAHIYRNRARDHRDSHALRVRLVGPPENSPAYGASVTAHAGDLHLSHQHFPTRGYLSTSDPVIHFGLGANTRVDSLLVRWPDGRRRLLRNVPADTLIVMAYDPTDHMPPPRIGRMTQTWLVDRTAETGLQHVIHSEHEVNDFLANPLAPFAHSRMGPPLAVGDINGDGLDDAYLGGDAGTPGRLLIQSPDGTFAVRDLEGSAPFEDRGATFFDADGDGDLDLYVVSGGTHHPEGDPLYEDRLVLNSGDGTMTPADDGALPALASSGSCVAAADFDGDGDVDLFVCGRITPGSYPTAPRSTLLRNDTPPGGSPRFTDVTAEFAPDLVAPGMVTSAVWLDFDGDGALDLVIAGEWMPIRFFRNENGRFRDATGGTGLPETSGWWNVLHAADLDGDGLVDLVGGNLGLNSRYRGSRGAPLLAHVADFDFDGRPDPLISHIVEGKRHLIHPLNEVTAQIPSIRRRFPTYTAYAEATLDRSLSPAELEKSSTLRAVHFATSLLRNLGAGRFTVEELPARLQFSPVYAITSLDVTGNGSLDLLAVGNSEASEVLGGRYDASLGMLLLNGGNGRLGVTLFQDSGFFVEGQATSIAVLKGPSGRKRVLVARNDRAVQLYDLSSNLP
jgi:enediyne biosynthesis protein E4